jgi:nucleoside-diphosphate-sugar epimerase
MATSLVISSAGFIGSNIVRHHVARGKAVRVLDNFSPRRYF